MTKGILLILFLVFSSVGAMATTFTYKLDLENKISDKVRSIMAQVDLQSQVVVEVRLKKISTTLPGTGSEVIDMFADNQARTLDFDDIDRIDIKVLSRVSPLPKNIQKQIQETFLGQKNVYIKYEKMTESVSKILDQREEYESKQKEVIQNISTSLGDISGNSKSLKNTLIWLFAALFWAGLIIYWLSGRRAVSHYKMMAEVFAEKIGEKLARNESDHEVIDLNQRMQLQQQQNTPPESQAQLSHESQRLEMMAPLSLAALISDCYWCEADGYAVWLWNHMSPNKRSEVLDVWPKADLYIRSLLKVAAQGFQYHNHLYYLKPLAVLDVSQDDMKFWVGRFKGSWSLVSPLRQASMDFSLAEKIELSRQPVSQEAAKKLPDPSRQGRELDIPLEIGAVTEEDELAILQYPESVPDSLRADISSLVWVALLPPHEREILLSGVSATYLAEVWVGPAPVLAKLQEVMPEKKWTLLGDYLRRITPQRNNPNLRALSQEAVRILSQMPRQVSGGEPHEERKVS